jgi:hypothetical protein
MRKLVCILILGVFCVEMHAQRFRAGISGGVTISDINGADTRDNDNDFNKLGITLGGIVTTSLNTKWKGQMELNFTQKGSLQPPDSNNNGYYKIAFSYIEIPVLVKRKIRFSIRKKRVERMDFEFGFSYGRIIAASLVGNSNYNLPVSSKYINFNDVSLLAGLDYNFSQNFILCVRYSNSVIPVIRRNAPTNFNYTYTLNRGNNMVFQLSFKVLFGTAGKVGKVQEPPPPPDEQ